MPDQLSPALPSRTIALLLESPAGEPLISAELEAALVRELADSWDEINGNHFRGRMRRPQLGLHEAEGRFGQWNGGSRTLSLARSLVLGRSWGIVREVLKHE